ncbi:MAG: universal stress protein [Dehalococcoidia bacterium]
MFKNICVLVDNSPSSDACCDAAISIAQAFGSRVTGVHAYAARMHERRFRQMESTLPEKYLVDGELERQRTIHASLIALGLELISHSYLDALERRCREAEVPFDRKTLEGKNWEKLVEESSGSEYDLVVMGARGHGSTRPDTVGSVCHRVVRRIRTDTLVIRDLDAFKNGVGRPIVVAVDGSAEAFGVLQGALALGKAYDKPVEAVAAYDPYFHYNVFHSMVQVLSEEAARVFRFKEQERLHEEIIDTGLARLYQTHLEVARRLAETQGLALETTLLAGRAADSILAYAEKRHPWLLLVGRVGVHSREGMDIGGVTEQLIRTAPCNVLVGSRRYVPPLELWSQSSLKWTEDAQSFLERVPREHRSVLGILIQRLALERGHSVVTVSLVREAVEDLRPRKESTQRMEKAALTVALERLRSEDGPVYLCNSCGHATREARPYSCPVCKTPGDRFLAVDSAELEAVAKRQGGVEVEGTFDGRQVRWAKAALQMFKTIRDPHHRQRARLRVQKAARLAKMPVITVEFALRYLPETQQLKGGPQRESRQLGKKGNT